SLRSLASIFCAPSLGPNIFQRFWHLITSSPAAFPGEAIGACVWFVMYRLPVASASTHHAKGFLALEIAIQGRPESEASIVVDQGITLRVHRAAHHLPDQNHMGFDWFVVDKNTLQCRNRVPQHRHRQAAGLFPVSA